MPVAQKKEPQKLLEGGYTHPGVYHQHRLGGYKTSRDEEQGPHGLAFCTKLNGAASALGLVTWVYLFSGTSQPQKVLPLECCFPASLSQGVKWTLSLLPNFCGKRVPAGTSEAEWTVLYPERPLPSRAPARLSALKETSRNHPLLWKPGKAQRPFSHPSLLETLGEKDAKGPSLSQKAAGPKSWSFIHSMTTDLSIEEWGRNHPCSHGVFILTGENKRRKRTMTGRADFRQ